MIAVEDEVFTHTQIDEENKFGTFDGAKTAALKTKRQRKRTNSRSHSSDGNEEDPTSPMESEFPKLKLDASFKRDRRSRMGNGRGLPKKGGAGGKGVWGRAGDEINASAVKDDQDPNFEASEGDDIKLASYIPQLDKQEIEKNMKPLLLEYFENSEIDECVEAISSFNLGSENVADVLILAVSTALERKPAVRELCSRLVAEMYGSVIEPRLMEDAFVKLLNQVSDLELDNPGASEDVGKFLARAIADDCLPPAFLRRCTSYGLNKAGAKAVVTASSLLTMKYAMSKIDNVWGVDGLDRPTKYYENKLWFVLKEYLKSLETEEVQKSLLELDIPHFHHEVVYEAVILAMEQRSTDYEKSAQAMIDLLLFLGESNIVSRSQFEAGFKRVTDNLEDLTLDIPNAIALFSQFCDMSVAQQFMSTTTYEKLHPSRGRKRFVSEGDGGKIKNLPIV